MTIAYAIEDGLEPEEFIDVLKRSGLDARRPSINPTSSRVWSITPT